MLLFLSVVLLSLRPTHTLAPAAAAAARFPSPATPPADVLVAQLKALRTRDLPQTFRLFSRARRLAIEEGTRRDMRESNLEPDRVYAAMLGMLKLDCPGLIGHATSEIVGSLGDPEPQRGCLPRWICRVKVDDGAQNFVFTLTRQSAFDGGDRRDCDGFERCWFVWSIKPEGGGGGNDRAETPSKPEFQEPVPA
jgi:hypothetical protein